MIRTATAGTGLSARPATTANNLTATREGIWTALLYGPTCRAPSRGASGATRAIKEDGSVTTAIATKRSRGGRPRAEPFWGGGFFRRGYGYQDDD
jgi:hypothetical protein